MKISVGIQSKRNHQKILLQTNEFVKELQISPKASGFGSSVNGGELLLLSLATCFCNDIYREAAKRNIAITNVVVEVTGDFGAEGEPGSNFNYTANITSDAPVSEIDELIRYTDEIAEVHNTLRQGLAVTLVK